MTIKIKRINLKIFQRGLKNSLKRIRHQVKSRPSHQKKSQNLIKNLKLKKKRLKIRNKKKKKRKNRFPKMRQIHYTKTLRAKRRPISMNINKSSSHKDL